MSARRQSTGRPRVLGAPVDRIRHFADLSIRRACGFGFLAVSTTMVGAASDFHLAMRMGAIGVTFMVVVLVMKAMRAPVRNYRHTELWLLLDRNHGLPEPHAQLVMGGVLRDRYMWHATWAGGAAALLWVLALLSRYAGG